MGCALRCCCAHGIRHFALGRCLFPPEPHRQWAYGIFFFSMMAFSPAAAGRALCAALFDFQQRADISHAHMLRFSTDIDVALPCRRERATFHAAWLLSSFHCQHYALRRQPRAFYCVDAISQRCLSPMAHDDVAAAALRRFSRQEAADARAAHNARAIADAEGTR